MCFHNITWCRTPVLRAPIHALPHCGPTLRGGGVLQNWFNPTAHSPDYFNECALNLTNLQIPHTDSAYIGISTFDIFGSNQREYVSCELINPMQINQNYWVEFYTSVGDFFTRYTSNNLAVYFSDTALHSTNLYNINVNPQLKYFKNEIIDDTINWVKVSGLYQAHGGEQFITLGNFNTDAETTWNNEYTNNFGYFQTYFLIDDVSVIHLDSIPGGLLVNAGPDQTIQYGDTVFIGERISNMPDNWFLLNGTPLDTNTAGLYVSPAITTTYVVTRNLNGLYSTDTVTVFVLGGVGLEEKKKEEFKVYPVPNDGSFFIKGKLSPNDKVQVISIDGKVVYEYRILEDNQFLEINTNLPSGAYLVKLVSAGGNELITRNINIIKK